MKVVRLRSEHDFEAWRETARGLLIGGTAPAEVRWEVARDDLFAAPSDVAPVTGRAVGVVPERFIELAKVALFHQDPLRFELLYRVLFRLQKDKSLLSLRSDPDVARLYKLVSDLREQTQQRAWDSGVEDWDRWFAGALQSPALAAYQAEREALFAGRPVPPPTPVDFQLAALRQAGFSEAGTVWQLLDDYVIAGWK